MLINSTFLPLTSLTGNFTVSLCLCVSEPVSRYSVPLSIATLLPRFTFWFLFHIWIIRDSTLENRIVNWFWPLVRWTLNFVINFGFIYHTHTHISFNFIKSTNFNFKSIAINTEFYIWILLDVFLWETDWDLREIQLLLNTLEQLEHHPPILTTLSP